MYKSGDQIGGTFAIVDPSTGGLSAADALPTAVLVINGVDSAAIVTVEATETTGRYKWLLTLPAGIVDGDALAVWVAAAVGDVDGAANVWHGAGITSRPSDVLSAISAAIAGVAAAVWAYATRTLTSSAAEVAAALEGAAITVLRGDTLTVSWSGLGDLSDRTKLWLTAKADRHHPDGAAVFQVVEGAGLAVINGELATTPANAAVVVTDEVAGDVTLVLLGVETAKLSELVAGCWDLQILTASGPRTVTEGTASVRLDVTRATS